MADSDALSIIRELSDYAATTVAPGFADIGKGIGSIMLLIVVIYYISSILDGGKFQIKMLLPLLIFFFVCNFSWIATPVTSFMTTITESLVESCDNAKYDIQNKNNCSETANINDLHNQMVAENSPASDLVKDLTGKSDEQVDSGYEVTDDNHPQEPSTGKTRGLAKWIKKGIDTEVYDLSLKTQAEVSGEKYAEVGDSDPSKKHFTNGNCTFQSIVSSIISWICNVMSYVLRAFGGVMSGLVVAFGPITFAFAIFPGQGGTIKSWFIRLCQFSLWAPICALVDCFSFKIFDMLADAGGGSSVLMAIAVAICNLVALTSVPSIASMIIEGAQGAVSLSGGLQTIAGSLTGGLTAAAGAGSVVAGKDRVQAVRDTISGAHNAGVVGAVRDFSTKGHTFKGMLGRMHASGRATRLGKH